MDKENLHHNNINYYQMVYIPLLFHRNKKIFLSKNTDFLFIKAKLFLLYLNKYIFNAMLGIVKLLLTCIP